MRLSEEHRHQLRRRLEAVQLRGRLPSLVLGQGRAGALEEGMALGQADYGLGLPAGTGVQYRIGSITKTLTAAAVMQLAEAGRLDLRGPLSQSWPDAPHADLPLLDLLSHGSGLQREVPGGGWDTLVFPGPGELGASAREAVQLYPRDSWWHYSNLAFALLGELVARASGEPWEAYVRQHLLDPLGMDRSGTENRPPVARGYSVEPYSDELVEEPDLSLAGVAPAGALWSTAHDLCRWGSALCGAHPEVLSDSLVEQMRAPHTIADIDHWSLGFGLGLMLFRVGERILVGHTGGMPGFVAAVVADPESGEVLSLLCNGDSGMKVGPVAAELLAWLLQLQPVSALWAPGPPPPEALRAVLGHWWSEWHEWVFSWRRGGLEAVRLDGADETGRTRFRALGEDRFVAESGDERGEELIVVRGSDGASVEKLYWATYPFTRRPLPFGPGAG